MKTYPNLYYKLNSDLDLTGINHEPLFDKTNSFYGSFDGNGFSIKNMTVNKYTQYPSLFGFIYSGTVKNLNIIDFEITVPDFNTSAGTLNVGAVAGESWGTLDNVNVKGSIKGNGLTYGAAIGGLVGQADNLITNCNADVTIEISNVTKSGYMSYPFNIGGLIGVGFANIFSCNTQGTINVSQAHDKVIIGGLIGYFIVDGTDVALRNLEINNCITDIEIFNGSGSLAYNAGLIATIDALGELTIENCAAYGNITNGGRTSGFINYVYAPGASKVTIINSYVKNDIAIKGMAAGFIYWVSNESNKGGIFEIINCYSEGNIIATIAAGFCLIVSSDVKFYRCYSARNIQTFGASASFIHQI